MFGYILAVLAVLTYGTGAERVDITFPELRHRNGNGLIQALGDSWFIQPAYRLQNLDILVLTQ
jgi:hypothetical protein